MPRALGHSVLPLPCENRRPWMGILVANICFPVQAYRRFMWVSVQASIFLVLLYVRRTDWGSFSTGNTGPHFISSPPFSPTKEPQRSSLQDVQPSLAHPATLPRVLGTNALRCASVDSHGSNALHCCAYTSCDTCPTISGAHATIFESRIKNFPCLQQALAYSIGATLVQQDCCPQHHQPQHSMIELLHVYDIHLSELLL